MAAMPDTTANADRPLSSDELAADQAKSPQSTDSLDGETNTKTALPASEAEHFGEDADDDGDQQLKAAEALTQLPPG